MDELRFPRLGSMSEAKWSQLQRLAAVLALAPLFLLTGCADSPTAPGVNRAPTHLSASLVENGSELSAMMNDLAVRVLPDLPDQTGWAEMTIGLSNLATEVAIGGSDSVYAKLQIARNAMAVYRFGIEDVGVLAELDDIAISLDVIEKALGQVTLPPTSGDSTGTTNPPSGTSTDTTNRPVSPPVIKPGGGR